MKDSDMIDAGSINEPETIEHANYKKDSEGKAMGSLISSSIITTLCRFIVTA